MRFTRFCTLAMLPAWLAVADWKQFRGPNGSGVAGESGLPVAMSASENLQWRAPAPPGYSSPVLSDGRLFLTGYDDVRLITICMDRSTGKELWRKEAPRRLDRPHKGVNTPASPSPVTDGRNVYVLFGAYGLISYDRDGRERWKVELAPLHMPYGPGASPVIAGDKLLLLVDQDVDSYLLALDKDTGRTVWKSPRPEATHGFSTPVVYKPANGPDQVIVSGSFHIASYSLAGGEKLWWVEGMAWQAKSLPVLGSLDGKDLIFVHSYMPAMHELGPMPPEKTLAEMVTRYDADKDGKLLQSEAPDGDMKKLWFLFDLNGDKYLDEREWEIFQARNNGRSGLFAIRPGEKGKAPGDHILWKHDRGLPNIPSPLLYQGVLYLLREGGILTSFEPGSGRILKQGRVEGALGDYFASPIAADGKIYLASKEGKLAVVRAGGDWEVLKVNNLDEEIWATPAFGAGRIFVRTQQAIYCFCLAKH